METDNLKQIADGLCFVTTLFDYDRRNPWNCVHEIELDEADSDPTAVDAYYKLSAKEQETIEDWARESLRHSRD